MKIALFPGAMKPPHKGHFNVVKQLSDEMGEVIVIISKKDREGFTAEQSYDIWQLYKRLLPETVEIKIADEYSPIVDVVRVIKDNPGNEYFVVFGKNDGDNAKTFVKDKFKNVHIYDAGNYGNINATEFRQAIKERNIEQIKSFLPEGISEVEFMEKLGQNLHEIKIQPKQRIPKIGDWIQPIGDNYKYQIIEKDLNGWFKIWDKQSISGGANGKYTLEHILNNLKDGKWKYTSKPNNIPEIKIQPNKRIIQIGDVYHLGGEEIPWTGDFKIIYGKNDGGDYCLIPLQRDINTPSEIFYNKEEIEYYTSIGDMKFLRHEKSNIDEIKIHPLAHKNWKVGDIILIKNPNFGERYNGEFIIADETSDGVYWRFINTKLEQDSIYNSTKEEFEREVEDGYIKFLRHGTKPNVDLNEIKIQPNVVNLKIGDEVRITLPNLTSTVPALQRKHALNERIGIITNIQEPTTYFSRFEVPKMYTVLGYQFKAEELKLIKSAKLEEIFSKDFWYKTLIQEEVDKSQQSFSKLSSTQRNNIIKFIGYVIKQLGISEIPKLTISYDNKQVKERSSFAYYSPSENKVWVYVKNRNMADILRSIAHELVHHKQNQDNRLDSDSGKTGSDIENEANSRAGILLRDFGKENKQIYEIKIKPRNNKPKAGDIYQIHDIGHGDDYSDDTYFKIILTKVEPENDKYYWSDYHDDGTKGEYYDFNVVSLKDLSPDDPRSIIKLNEIKIYPQYIIPKLGDKYEVLLGNNKWYQGEITLIPSEEFDLISLTYPNGQGRTEMGFNTKNFNKSLIDGTLRKIKNIKEIKIQPNFTFKIGDKWGFENEGNPQDSGELEVVDVNYKDQKLSYIVSFRGTETITPFIGKPNHTSFQTFRLLISDLKKLNEIKIQSQVKMPKIGDIISSKKLFETDEGWEDVISYEIIDITNDSIVVTSSKFRDNRYLFSKEKYIKWFNEKIIKIDDTKSKIQEFKLGINEIVDEIKIQPNNAFLPQIGDILTYNHNGFKNNDDKIVRIENSSYIIENNSGERYPIDISLLSQRIKDKSIKIIRKNVDEIKIQPNTVQYKVGDKFKPLNTHLSGIIVTDVDGDKIDYKYYDIIKDPEAKNRGGGFRVLVDTFKEILKNREYTRIKSLDNKL